MIFYLFLFALLLLPSTEAFAPRPTVSAIRTDAAILQEPSNRSTNAASRFSPPAAFQLNPWKLRSIPSTTNLYSSSSSSNENHNSESRPTRIIIAGAPASGKGTQCEKITAKYGVVHLSTGDMLRAAVAAGTQVGREAKAYMDAGKLVPDGTIIGVVRCVLGSCRWTVAV
jgi:adenylate kinase